MTELVNASFASVKTRVQFPEPMWGVHSCNPSTGEVEPGGSSGRLAQLSLIVKSHAKERSRLQGDGPLSRARVVLEVVAWF